jgi:hypothetical protein
LTGRSCIHRANADDIVDLLLKVVDTLLDVGVLVGLLAVLLLVPLESVSKGSIDS